MFFGNFVEDEAHVALYLPHDSIAGSTFFKFDDEKLFPVFADGEEVDGASVAGILLPNDFAFFGIEVVIFAERGLTPVTN